MEELCIWLEFVFLLLKRVIMIQLIMSFLCACLACGCSAPDIILFAALLRFLFELALLHSQPALLSPLHKLVRV